MKAHRPIPVIFNPTAGGGRARRKRKDLETVASQREISLDWRATRAPGHATQLAARAADESHPLIFAFGGDGTYNEVARGLLGRETAMGVLPAGTTSVLAYEFEIPRPVGLGMMALLDGEDREMHVGSTDRGEIFLIMLSAGPDSMVLQRLYPFLKILGGRVGVAAQGILELFRPQRMPAFALRVDQVRIPAGWAIVGKSRSYAGPFEATPGADPFAPAFEVVAQTTSGRRAALGFVSGIARGRHLGRKDVLRFDAAEVLLGAPPSAGELHYQIDGDLGGALPVRVSLHPEKLRLRLPVQQEDVGPEASAGRS